MSFGGINAGLNTATPSGSSQAGLAPADFQSIKTTFQQVLDSEHIFPSTGGAGSGAHRKGSAVIYVGTASQVSSADTDGRLMLTSDTSKLFHIGSADTIVLGGRHVAFLGPIGENGATFSSGRTQHWQIESGTATIFPSAATTVTLQNTYVRATVLVTQGGTVLGSTSSHRPIANTILGGTNTFLVTNLDADGNIASANTAYYVGWMVAGYVAL